MSKSKHQDPQSGSGSGQPADQGLSDSKHSSAEQLKEEAKQAGQQAKAELNDAVDEIKEQGKQAAVEAKEKAIDAIEQRLPAAAEQVDGVASALRETAEKIGDNQPWVADGARRTASLLDSASKSLRENDFNGLLRNVEKQTREQPAVVLGGAVVAGFILTRFLKSSADREEAAPQMSSSQRSEHRSRS